MGQESNKMSRHDASNKVLYLRSQIEARRQHLSMELGELRRRRQLAMRRAGSMVRRGGIAFAGLLMLGSVARALVELMSARDQAL